jgi:hypothetical protein
MIEEDITAYPAPLTTGNLHVNVPAWSGAPLFSNNLAVAVARSSLGGK